MSSALESTENAARQEILTAEENAWETEILGYYRRVAAAYNKKIEDEFRPLFDALLQQASRGPGS